MMLNWVLAAYGTGLTLLVILIQRRQTKRNSLPDIVSDVVRRGGLSLEDLKAVAEIAKINQSEIPWYERSLSTIGIIAFFSMLIATGVQTMKGTVDQLEVGRLKQEMQSLQSQRNLLDSLIPEVTRVAVDQYRQSGHLPTDAEQLLRNRLNQLDRNEKPTKEQLIEQFDIALTIEDYNKATSILKRNIDLLDDTDASSLITLAEFNFLNGSPGLAREQIERVEPQMSKLPDRWKFRVMVLATLLNPDKGEDRYKALLAKQLRIGTEDASKRLETEIRKWNRAAERFLEGKPASDRK